MLSKRLNMLHVGAAAPLLCLIVVGWNPAPWMLYNDSPSIPLGWYIHQNKSPIQGDLVAFRLPSAAHAYAQERGVSTDILLLKPIVAVAGDHVSTLNGQLEINGNVVCSMPAHDSRGRRLPIWHESRVLHEDELFIYSARIPNSFDSRFFGPVRIKDVIGVYRKLSFSGNSDGPAKRHMEHESKQLNAHSRPTSMARVKDHRVHEDVLQRTRSK